MSDRYIYFIQADENGPIKIGFTSDDPNRRLSQLQTGNASALKLLGAIKGTFARERQFHIALSKWRLQGEWFESHPTVLATIQDALSSPAETDCEPDVCLRCSFCFRCIDDIEGTLVAGPAANICEDCIKMASDAVAAQKCPAPIVNAITKPLDPPNFIVRGG
jgi:hypothetical protein